MSMMFMACVNDSTPPQKNNVQAETKVEDHSGHDHSGHDHSGHDHSGHDHSGHDHSGHDHSGHNHNNTTEVAPNKKSRTVTKEVTIDKKAQLKSLEEVKGDVPDDQYQEKKRAIENAREKITTQAKVAAENPSTAYLKLPDACTLVTDKFIGKTIGVNPMAINIKDGSGPASSHARACFFRWDHEGIPNSGVMVQVMDNPLPDEFPEWASYYIKAKIDGGDVKPDGTGAFKYKKLDGVGLSGAYSFDMHQYLMRTEAGYIIGVAFNLPASEDEELAWSKIIGKEVIKNLK